VSARTPSSSQSRGNLAISAMQASDWDDVRRIYAEGIATGNATMETSAPDWETCPPALATPTGSTAGSAPVIC